MRHCVALTTLSVTVTRQKKRVRNKLVACYIWSTALYGGETDTSEGRSEYFESFKMWCWMEKIYWTDRVRNEGV